MKSSKPEVLPAPAQPMSTATFAQHARTVVTYHGEAILAEVPRMLRRIGMLFFALSVAIPVFLVGLLVVLWRLAG
jgi:hypothetical protein